MSRQEILSGERCMFCGVLGRLLVSRVTTAYVEEGVLAIVRTVHCTTCWAGPTIAFERIRRAA